MATRRNQRNEGDRGDRCVVEIEDTEFMTRLRDGANRLSSDFGGPAVADIRDVEFDGRMRPTARPALSTLTSVAGQRQARNL